MQIESLKQNLQSLSENDLFIVLQRARRVRFQRRTLNIIKRVDLWLFPSMAFASNYHVLTNFFPGHPVKLFAILASSFMSATLTLFIIRPPKRRSPGHWVGL